mgnify:CR=1 FL=1
MPDEYLWKFGDIVSLDPESPARSWRFMLITPSATTWKGTKWRAWPLRYVAGLPETVYIWENTLHLIEAAADV